MIQINTVLCWLVHNTRLNKTEGALSSHCGRSLFICRNLSSAGHSVLTGEDIRTKFESNNNSLCSVINLIILMAKFQHTVNTHCGHSGCCSASVI